jgi:transcriptional regulator with XRE-family HTH domain
MKLSDYMEMAKITDQDFAGRVGLERSTVTRLRNGKTVPSFQTLERIHAETKGAVSFNDFLHEQDSAA